MTKPATTRWPWPAGPRLSETQRFLLISVLIGVSAGLLAVLFHIAIDSMKWATIGAGVENSPFAVLLSPMLGAAAATLLVRYVVPSARGNGVNLTKAALYANDGEIPASTVAGKFAVCTLSIGTGSSLGPEDPALQMGAGVASYIGRVTRLPKRYMRMIAPIGAAAGIGAAFNTPIMAVLFVMEEVVGAWNAGVLGSIVLAAVSAVVVERTFLGDEPLFRVPTFTLTHPSELLVYAVIGVVGGLLAALFVRVSSRLRDRLQKAPQWQRHLQPLAAGLAVGVIGLWLPEVMGAGYAPVDSALHNQYSWQMLVILGLAKILATMLCFASGIPGGMFAPALFVGAMIGGGIGAAAHTFWPTATSAASAYVLVGMGTFFVGIFRSPMTSIFMVFEVSRNYVIILPVMIANTISYLVSRKLQYVPFFDLVAEQDGFHLPSLEEEREVTPMRVEDAMGGERTLVIPSDFTVARALRRMEQVRAESGLVVTLSGHWYPVLRNQLAESAANGRADVVLAHSDLLEEVPEVYPDMMLDSALRLMEHRRLLPVVSRTRSGKLLGVLTIEGVNRAYKLGEDHAGTTREPDPEAA